MERQPLSIAEDKGGAEKVRAWGKIGIHGGLAGGQEGDGCPVDVFASYLADSANSTTGE